MPVMALPPEGSWPDPRDVSVSLLDGELPLSLFAVLDWPDFRARIEPHLDGQRHRYVYRAHFDYVCALRGDEYMILGGALRVVRFMSDAATWPEFAADYYRSVRTFIRWRGFFDTLRGRKDGVTP